MEKPGMDCRSGCRTGLLNLFLLPLFLLAVLPCRTFAQDLPVDELEVLTRVQSVQTEPGMPVKITFLVNYPAASEVEFSVPQLPEALREETRRIELRLVRSDSGRDERWTVIEYILMPLKSGTYVLDPFTIRVPGRQHTGDSLQFTVLDSVSEDIVALPVLRWDSVPSRVVSSRPFRVYLKIENQPAGISPDEVRKRLEIVIPENILAEQRVPSTKETGLLLEFNLIPLSGPEMELPMVRLALEDTVVSTRHIRIPVSENKVQDQSVQTRGAVEGSSAEDAEIFPFDDPAFPAASNVPFVPFFLRTQYENVLESARVAWEQRDYSAALAVLRQGERDLEAGYAIKALRKNAEQAIGINDSEEEVWIPAKIFLILVTVLTVLFVFFFISALRRRYSWLFLIPVVLLLGVYAQGIRMKNGAVILRSCTAYRIPDAEGGRSARFSDGSRVIRKNSGGAWVFVEANDGRAGWVTADRVINY